MNETSALSSPLTIRCNLSILSKILGIAEQSIFQILLAHPFYTAIRRHWNGNLTPVTIALYSEQILQYQTAWVKKQVSNQGFFLLPTNCDQFCEACIDFSSRTIYLHRLTFNWNVLILSIESVNLQIFKTCLVFLCKWFSTKIN